MATVKLWIRVSEIDDVLLKFNRIKVYRCLTETGTYEEITNVSTRIVLVAGTTAYEYIDTTAPTSYYWYRTAYYHSTSLLESSVSEAMQGIDGGLYCTLQDIRDEGITTSELDDTRALKLSATWQKWFEDMTGNFFVAREETLDFDGDGSRMLLLPVPIISVTSLYVNDDFSNAVDPSYYVVYNSRGPIQDDRRNPHIMLKRSTGTDIFTSVSGGLFAIGDRNQRVVGTWGYVEADGSTPLAVSRAILILVTLTKEYLPDDKIDQFVTGRAIEEVTDRHRIRYADVYNSLKSWGPTGITEVDLALRRYRSPMRIAAPRTMRVV